MGQLQPSKHSTNYQELVQGYIKKLEYIQGEIEKGKKNDIREEWRILCDSDTLTTLKTVYESLKINNPKREKVNMTARQFCRIETLLTNIINSIEQIDRLPHQQDIKIWIWDPSKYSMENWTDLSNWVQNKKWRVSGDFLNNKKFCNKMHKDNFNNETKLKKSTDEHGWTPLKRKSSKVTKRKNMLKF